MPHELVTWGANEKKFWSEYTPDGRMRYCKCYAPVPMDDTGKRAIHVFGGRKTTPRHENGGLCDPERCNEYQNRQCNLSGRFIFFIPGIKSIGAFELRTNSFYAMNAAIQKFETIAFMRGGRISGFLDAKQTSFYITKKLMEVPHIDEEGRAVRVAHWIIELEAPIDVTALLRVCDEDENAMVNAAQAVRVLEGSSGGDVRDEPQVDVKNGDAFDAAAGTDGGASQAKLAEDATSGQRANDNGPDLQRVLNSAAVLGISSDRYSAYAGKRWGPGWKINAAGRRHALAEIESFRDDRQGFADKLSAALDVLSQ